MVEKNSHKQIIITNLADVDLDSFVRIHMSLLLKGGKITKLYLEERFKYLLNDKGAIAIVARDNNGNFLGLVYGGG